MNYYKITESTASKVIGPVFPQGEGVYPVPVDDPAFVSSQYPGIAKIEKPVVLPMARLRKKTVKQTDLLSLSAIGALFKLLISEKMYKILAEAAQVGIQYLPTTVFDQDNVSHAYYFANAFVFCPEYIDFARSEIFLRGPGGVQQQQVFCDSLVSYELAISQYAPAPLVIYKVAVAESEVMHDFFALNGLYGGPGYFVSERLKNRLEDAGCTGIDFLPAT